MRIWEMVKAVEETPLSEAQEAKALLIENYGKLGKTIPGIIYNDESLFHMVLRLAQYYENRLNSLKENE